MPDVIALGEAIIDFVSNDSGVSLSDAGSFTRAAGGAPANVSVGLARLGVNVGFIGKVGDDPFGHFLIKTLRENSVDTTHMIADASAKTMLAFVSLKADGERDFVFYGNPRADTMLRESEIDPAYISSASIFHFGSISLTTEPSRSATLKAKRIALDAGVLVSCDPNIRMSLWPDPDSARSEIRAALPRVDLIKVSEEELEFITDAKTIEDGCGRLVDGGAKLVTVTLGPEGSYWQTSRSKGYVPGFKTEAVDTTGAGDAFLAGLLAGLLNSAKSGATPDSLGESDYRDILKLANAAGSLVVRKRGVINALPYLDAVNELARAGE